LVPDGAACADAGDPECDHSICNSGTCIIDLEGSGVPCTPDEEPCTRDECDGNGLCRHDAGNTGLECRAATGVCDVAEQCTGVDVDCPPDVLASAGTPCGSSSNTECSNPDTCNGSGTCMANDEPDGTGCGNPSNTDCDDPDTCGGGTCAANFVVAGTACGNPADTDCTDPDVCNGSGTCLATDAANGTACGSPSDSECDNPDTCNAGTCMTNPEVTGAPCTPDASPCTLDQCTGSGACAHPAGNAGTPCRAAADACDAAEQCTGTNVICPPDSFAPGGTACGSATDTDCTDPDSCDGNGVCLANDSPDGTSCDDASVCTQGDQCQDGTCMGASPLDCDDGSFCTLDSCDPFAGCQNDGAPASGCKTALQSLLLLKRAGNPDRDKIVWKWQKGELTDIGELGNPTASTTYGLCVYDATDTLIADLILPAGAPPWSTLGNGGFKYKDISLTNGGAQLAIVKPGAPGRAKAQVKGKGADLADPPLGALVLPLTVQLRNDDTSACFEHSFDVPDVIRNDTEQFKARQ
jgi:hypothetical protein